MFLEKDLIEFINKLINQSSQSKEETKANINQFQEYLELTKMASTDTLKNLEQVVSCLDEVLTLKEKLGTFDITTLFPKEEVQQKKVKVKEKKKEPEPITTKTSPTPYVEKHYHHYESYTPSYISSSSCGGGGGGSSYRSSC